MDYKCSEEMFKICENNSKCYLCDGQRLYREPKWIIRKKKQEEKKRLSIKKKKKEGMSFEKKVKKRYNKAITQNVNKENAKRRPNSGAIWSMPGDIVTEEELIECKERGTTTSKGEKVITIPKEHLEKIKNEAYFAGKDVWYYIYQYKGDNNIYLVKDFNDELKMIQQIKSLKQRINDLEEKIKLLKGDN